MKDALETRLEAYKASKILFSPFFLYYLCNKAEILFLIKNIVGPFEAN
jgi:hypothetical protein